jgi:hypothetical protein
VANRLPSVIRGGGPAACWTEQPVASCVVNLPPPIAASAAGSPSSAALPLISQVVLHCVWDTFLTSGRFVDSMSAAARPKRWGVSRQGKARELDPTRVELFTLLT